MKHRIISLVGLCLAAATVFVSFTGCGMNAYGEYVDVHPHDETYVMTDDKAVAKVTSQLSLKNAVLNFVMDCAETAVIHADAYSDDMPTSISQVVNEVTQVDPIGVFAIKELTYEYSVVVNYYEITLHISYRVSKDVLDSIVYLANDSKMKGEITHALSDYRSSLILNVDNFQVEDIDKLMRDVYISPKAAVVIYPEYRYRCYPESGEHRIVELQFDYGAGDDACIEMRDSALALEQEVVERYQHIEDPETKARLLYNYVCRSKTYIPSSGDVHLYADSPYGVLAERCGTSLGFAKTYQRLLVSSGIMCSIVSGYLDDMPRYWCRVEISGSVYYVDPSNAVESDDMRIFLLRPLEMLERGYRFV